MKISLIVCTYMRPNSLFKLLKTVEKQTKVPDEILIVDGSRDTKTEEMINSSPFDLNLTYHKVSDKDRGLTRQRNFGIKIVSDPIDIVAFLDDDIELDPNYFAEIARTYILEPDAVAVGGVSTNEVEWIKADKTTENSFKYFTLEGWSRRDDIRYRIRKTFRLIHNKQPGRVVSFGHERSIGFLPPTGKIYETDFLMGGIASYKKELFKHLSYSSFFEGYGLYEDRDFSLRIRKYGKIYINTNAKVEHHHDPLGRPDYIKYGQMVVWNGWRIWRVATPNPSFFDKLKWWSITILLTYARLGNVVTGPTKKESFQDFFGRHIGMFKLIISKPNLDR